MLSAEHRCGGAGEEGVRASRRRDRRVDRESAGREARRRPNPATIRRCGSPRNSRPIGTPTRSRPAARRRRKSRRARTSAESRWRRAVNAAPEIRAPDSAAADVAPRDRRTAATAAGHAARAAGRDGARARRASARLARTSCRWRRAVLHRFFSASFSASRVLVRGGAAVLAGPAALDARHVLRSSPPRSLLLVRLGSDHRRACACCRCPIFPARRACLQSLDQRPRA